MMARMQQRTNLASFWLLNPKQLLIKHDNRAAVSHARPSMMIGLGAHTHIYALVALGAEAHHGACWHPCRS
jgi:hypothetical protein